MLQKSFYMADKKCKEKKIQTAWHQIKWPAELEIDPRPLTPQSRLASSDLSYLIYLHQFLLSAA